MLSIMFNVHGTCTTWMHGLWRMHDGLTCGKQGCKSTSTLALAMMYDKLAVVTQLGRLGTRHRYIEGNNWPWQCCSIGRSGVPELADHLAY